MGDVRRERPHPQQKQRQTLTIDIMATGEGRRGQQKPFLIPSQRLIQTLRLMLTMAIMAMVAGMLLTMATLGPTTMVTTGAKVIRSRLLELETQKTATTAFFRRTTQ